MCEKNRSQTKMSIFAFDEDSQFPPSPSAKKKVEEDEEEEERGVGSSIAAAALVSPRATLPGQKARISYYGRLGLPTNTSVTNSQRSSTRARSQTTS